MKREVQKISRLREEATAYGVEFCDGKVTIETPVGNKGSGLFVTHDLVEENKVLVSVPADLVLSLEVGSLLFAKSPLSFYGCVCLFMYKLRNCSPV